MAFFVGQRVICIRRPETDKFPDEIYPVKGGEYTVRDIVDFDDGAAIRLDEIVNRSHYYAELGRRAECCFCVSHFRPVSEKKTDISIFTSMLTPAPKVREDA